MNFLDTIGDDAAVAVWAALVAQVQDVHAPVWSLTDDQHDAARALFDLLSEPEILTTLASAVLKCLCYPVHDMDHVDLTPGEWSAAEVALAQLTVRVDAMTAA